MEKQWKRAKTHHSPALPVRLLLKTYYDSNGNLLKEVFIGVPEELAVVFAREKLTTKQLRDFFQTVLRARNTVRVYGIERARPILYKCKPHLVYQKKREKIPQSFLKFMEHHLELAEKDKKSLDGFYQHLDSIVCYFPKQ